MEKKPRCHATTTDITSALSVMLQTADTGPFRWFSGRSIASLALASKAVRELLQRRLLKLQGDISRGHEALPVPLRIHDTKATLFAPRELEEIHGSLQYTYVTQVQMPVPRAALALPAAARAAQMKRSERTRRVAQGRQVNVLVRKDERKGYAVYAAEPIAQGEYLGEYTGELLSTRELHRRYAENYDRHHINYALVLRERMAERDPDADTNSSLSFTAVRTIVDAFPQGNFTRFYNHNCDPTLELTAVRVDSYVPRLVFFTRRPVAAKEELCFDYGHAETAAPSARNRAAEPEGRPCHCGSASCRGMLPFDTSI